jgi:ribosome recycling factor
MTAGIDHLVLDFHGVRTGKASPALIDNLDVYIHAYGATQKLKSLAVISSPEPRMLNVQPFDPSTTRDIEKAIRESKERRRDMVKLIKTLAEEAKVRLRGTRKAGIDEAKKMKSENILTEDTLKTHEKAIQDLTNKFTKRIDELAAAKEEDLMKI